MRMRVSLASILKRAITLTASTNERSGRALSAGRPRPQRSSGVQQDAGDWVDCFRFMGHRSFSSIITLYRVIVSRAMLREKLWLTRHPLEWLVACGNVTYQ